MSLLRWRAEREARRRKLEMDLLAAPLDQAGRERLTRMLANHTTREAWHEARLEHIRDTKRILQEILGREAPAPVPTSQPTASRTRPARRALSDTKERG